ncbi:MAG: FkbM family methyltransferase [Gammaproteobacteria bacterium]|nr:FkbM family methyltransferase [Gammaproteobacteria bacterium]
MHTDLDDESLSRQLQINHKRKENLRFYVEFVRSEKSDDLFIVEIGAMDGVLFDDIHEHVALHNWRGLLVEPLADEYEKLIENYSHTNDRLQFARVAVTESSGSQVMIRVKPEENAPLHYRGMSSCFTDRNDLADLRDSCVSVTVESVTLHELLERYSVEKIDILQTDTEGYDYRILRQLDFSRFSPLLILFETCCLPVQELNSLKKLLHNQGYHLIQNGPADCVASLFPPPVEVEEFYSV